MKRLMCLIIVCCLTGICLAEDPWCWAEECSCQMYGDANCDGYITAIDVQILLDAWGGNLYDPCPDFNRDGVITAQDVMLLISAWGGEVECPSGPGIFE